MCRTWTSTSTPARGTQDERAHTKPQLSSPDDGEQKESRRREEERRRKEGTEVGEEGRGGVCLITYYTLEHIQTTDTVLSEAIIKL